MRIKELSKQEGIMLKGIAILLVIMHNYCHEFSFAVEANEFIWIKDNITLFNHHPLSLDNNLIDHAFSFGGHYGVVLFLFVSGYGLFRILFPIFIIPISIYLIIIVSKNSIFTPVLTNIGKTSAYIFITHSIIHWIFLPSDDEHPHIYLYLMLYLILCISMGCLYSLLLKILKF